MKVAYFDCYAGISGDMIVGAFLDAGLPLELLKGEFNKLDLNGWDINAYKIKKQGITGTKFQVLLHHEDHHDHHGRNLHHIINLITQSTLNNPVKETAVKIFKRLAEAEAKVHGTTVDKIHFHEVGALDSILDILGAAVAIHHFKIHRVYSSVPTTGSGFVRCAHGTIPVPAPATVELLRGVPYRHGDISTEMVTPTGAAVLSALCEDFGPMPTMISQRVGYGGGDRELAIPNLLRVHIGELLQLPIFDNVHMIEANIDDMNPEYYNRVIERLLDSGALDVYISNVLMKKNRPGTVLHVLSPGHIKADLELIIFEETTTIGLRSYPVERNVLHRDMVHVNTKYGVITLKVARQGDKILNIAPEHDLCLSAAKMHSIPLKLVYNEVIKVYLTKDN